MSEEQKDYSRRNFLRGGILAAGAMAVGASVLAPFGANVVKAAETTAEGTCDPNTTCTIPEGAWPYAQLDVEKAKVLGYEGYGKDRCAYGAFYSIISQLQEKVGYPYTMVPTRVLQWGATGGAGWGVLCGALTGACTAINYVVGPKRSDVEKVVSELFGWYTGFEFPQYVPPLSEKIKVNGALPKSVSGSVLCHASVGNWCEVSKYRAESPERSERCARVTADVAAKTVELLNNWHSKTFVPVYPGNETVEECMSCHGEGRSLENARGKMDCGQCHTDVDPKDLLAHIKENWEILK